MHRLERHLFAGDTEILPDGNHGWWERKILEFDDSDSIYTIEDGYSGVDGYIQLATAIYNYPSLGIFICQYNSILDPVNEFIPGKTIRLPSKERLNIFINSKKD